ncbi:hypothetical protein CWI36_0554p0010 [Hamiltosporidium magnivora]|uniref:Uncharacterized protein n=1 Tax=Hamiltosporidium magnivora TaxID=148818 RepID=A0A4Q9LDB8_9MICR|nr:hypothetical protein CWI36_0554p0010 [Hamiltosporidium magnivora]
MSSKVKVIILPNIYVKRINPRYLEEYQDICELIKKILLMIRDTFIQINNVMNHISLSESLKYIFEDIIKIMGMRDLFHTIAKFETFISRLLETIPKTFFMMIENPVSGTNRDFIKKNSDKKDVEKNASALKHFTKNKSVYGLISLTKQNDSEFLQEFRNNIEIILSSNWSFYQYVIKNPEIMDIFLVKIFS